MISPSFLDMKAKPVYPFGMNLAIPEPVKKTAEVLVENGFQAFLVGGAVRDSLLHRVVQDYDIATDASPPKVMSLFRRVIPTGLKHGTVTVLEGHLHMEVTTFRKEDQYSDFRRPDQVTWSNSIEEDLCRRDFTINGMAYDIRAKKLVDPYSGRQDLEKGLLRAIGSPRERFREDPLRIMRACRFGSQLGFSVEPATFQAMKESSGLIAHISAERIRDELVKILLSPKPSVGIEMMRESLILALILPELDACRGVKQPEFHAFDVYYHSLYSCDGAEQDNLSVRLAALLHDIGKPECVTQTYNGETRFYGHEKKGAQMSRLILERLRFSNQEKTDVSHLINEHMFAYEPAWNDAAVRRFIRRIGRENIPNILKLRMADQAGMQGHRVDSPLLAELGKRIESVIDSESALSLKDLTINGDMIQRELGLKPSSTIGTILNFLLESVLDDPELNTRDKLLEIARNFYLTRIGPSGSQ